MAPAVRAVAIHLLRAGVAVLLLMAAYDGYALIRYSTLPHWGMLTVNVPVFYAYGGMMVPMPANHPWILVIGLYTLTLARAGQSLLQRENSQRQQLMFVTAVLGTGLFTYYQGRSHDNNLVLVMWPASTILALYADQLMTWRRAIRDRLVLAPIYSAAFALLFFQCFPLVMIPDVVRVTKWVIAADIRAIRDSQSGPVLKNIELLRHYSKPDEALAILSYRAGVYLAETSTFSPFTGPGLTEMLWRSDLDSLERQVAALPNVPLLVDFQDLQKGSFGLFPAGVLDRLLTGRVLVEQNLPRGGSLAAFVKTSSHTEAPTGAWLFSEDPADLPFVHLRPTSAGYLEDSNGHFAGLATSNTPPLKGGNFTIEVLVTPRVAEAPWATIISTHPGTSYFRGFVLHHAPEHENAYNFTVGTGHDWIVSPEFVLSPNAINYFCVVLHGELVRIYLNGSAVAEFKAPGGLAESDFPLTVGNWQLQSRPFNGTISEVYLRERELRASEIAARWQTLQAKIR